MLTRSRLRGTDGIVFYSTKQVHKLRAGRLLAGYWDTGTLATKRAKVSSLPYEGNIVPTRRLRPWSSAIATRKLGKSWETLVPLQGCSVVGNHRTQDLVMAAGWISSTPPQTLSAECVTLKARASVGHCGERHASGLGKFPNRHRVWPETAVNAFTIRSPPLFYGRYCRWLLWLEGLVIGPVPRLAAALS